MKLKEVLERIECGVPVDLYEKSVDGCCKESYGLGNCKKMVENKMINKGYLNAEVQEIFGVNKDNNAVGITIEYVCKDEKEGITVRDILPTLFNFNKLWICDAKHGMYDAEKKCIYVLDIESELDNFDWNSDRFSNMEIDTLEPYGENDIVANVNILEV